jgi:N-acetylneuraminic acid mutarotase
MPLTVDGAGVTVLNGSMYVIGGCDYYACDRTEAQVYHPSTNTWTSAAAYPQPVSWEGCGDDKRQDPCVGGDDSATDDDTSNAYVYDSASNSWSSIAPIPIDNWAMGYSVGNGQLLLSGGVTDNDEEITNQGFAYDPADNTWTALPNSNEADYGGGSGCGFYLVGGINSYLVGDHRAAARLRVGHDQRAVAVGEQDPVHAQSRRPHHRRRHPQRG